MDGRSHFASSLPEEIADGPEFESASFLVE